MAARKTSKPESNLLTYPEFLVAMQNTFATDLPRKTAPAAFLEIYIDNYANIIGWYDYQRATEIIDEVVLQFSAVLDEGDCLCRMHLDRIGFLLSDYSSKELEKTIKKLREIIEDFESTLFRKPMHIIASMGSVMLPKSGGTIDEILHKAYIARASADGTSSLYYARFEDVETGLESTRNEAQIMYDVQQILDENRFETAYQPIINAKMGDVEYYECLLRILHPDSAPTSAGGLIPIAEKMHFIKIIDRMMLQKVYEQLKQNPKLKLTFNVSNATPDLLQELEATQKQFSNPCP